LRDELRAKQVPAKTIIAMFDQDHVVLHAFGGPDRWWNFTPLLRPAHREKSRRDKSIIAKTDRLEEAQRAFNRRMSPTKTRRRIEVPLRTEGFKGDEPLPAGYLNEALAGGPPVSDRELEAHRKAFVQQLLKPTRRRQRRRGPWPKGRKLQSRSSFERRP
jgi:hypothetical protein